MKLIKLHIENFGKLSGVDIDLQSGLNEIYKENGWGKTTLCVFIKTMFYSMPARARGELFKFERTHYMPWQGGKYGGFIEYETEEGLFRVTRYFDKTPEGDFFELKNYSTNKTENKENEILGDSLFGLGRESFEVTSFFPQLEFASMANNQITASLTGVDKFQNDLANVNSALKIIDAKISVLKKGKPKKEDVEVLKRKLKENENLIESKKNEKLNNQEKLIGIVSEIEKLNKSYSQAKENYELQNKEFENKLSLEKSLIEENEKHSQFLQKYSLLKDKADEEERKEKEKGKHLSKILILGAVPFAVLLILLTALIVVKIVPVLIGIVLIMSIIAGAIVCEFLIAKKKNFKPKSEQIKGIEEEIKSCEIEIKICQKKIQFLKDEISRYGDIKTPRNIDAEEILSQLNDKKIEKSTIESSDLICLKAIDEILEVNDKLNSDLNLVLERDKDIAKKIDLLVKTKEFILKAKENVSTRFVVPVNKEFKEILSKFTDLEKDYEIDTEWKVKENTAYGSKDFEYSSQGLQDIVSFCQRVNLIKQIYKKEKPFLILDDTFVNLDDNKLAVAKQIVEDLSRDFQIIYICCNNRCKIKAD